jgi:thiamine-monophosphate kinase
MNTIRESDILRLLANGTPADFPHVIEGVADQDDCAVIRLPQGRELCATTDFVRGTGFHLFRAGYLTFEDIGYYLVAANLSDLAAMGASPLCFLSVVRYKADRTLVDIEAILRGIAMACQEFACPLVGGDTGSYESDVLSGTALGTVRSGRRLSRRTMKPGQAIFVSGDLGRPAAAIAAVSNDIVKSHKKDFGEALAKWRRPRPQIELGLALVETALPVSCMDVSDGLTASLQQLARIAKCGFDIDGSKLPIHSSVTAIADEIHTDPIHLACSASVDFELLFSAPPDAVDEMLKLGARASIPICHIGFATENIDIKMRKPNGEYFATLPGIPWDHQVSDITKVFRHDARP